MNVYTKQVETRNVGCSETSLIVAICLSDVFRFYDSSSTKTLSIVSSAGEAYSCEIVAETGSFRLRSCIERSE